MIHNIFLTEKTVFSEKRRFFIIFFRRRKNLLKIPLDRTIDRLYNFDSQTIKIIDYLSKK